MYNSFIAVYFTFRSKIIFVYNGTYTRIHIVLLMLESLH